MGTYPPRECGIATFTQDLVRAIDQKVSPSVKSAILAMNKNGTNMYNYSGKVLYQLNDSDISEYIDLAKKINRDDRIKIINIQHEFGIFGGEYGSYLIAFLEVIEKPVVITFHSILPGPNEQLKKVVQSIARKVNAIITMSHTGKGILRRDYGIKTDIFVIPHGIPYTPFMPSSVEKKNLGYEDKLVISSFGMINPGKGYEYVIESLPEVVKKFPNLLYIIVGETHPVVRKNEGEGYRNFLERKVKELGLHGYVKFYNKYVTLKEIVMYLRASDIYISSGLDPNQITSGTLSYALGCGRPVISTPFLHAREDLNGDRGVLLEDFKEPEMFKDALIKLLSNPEMRKQMSTNAYHYTRKMTWDNVANSYKEVFSRYLDVSNKYLQTMPKIKFNHLVKLTDNFGIVQFANNTVPNLSMGYSLDDVARALIVCGMHYQKYSDPKKLELMDIYLNFMEYVQDNNGKFYNFVDKDKNIDRDNYSEDAHGRAVWALGYLTSLNKIPVQFINRAKIMMERSFGLTQLLNSPRAMCFSMIGHYYFNKYENNQINYNIIKGYADKLLYFYNESSTNDWKWFEKILTYDNSKFPEALLFAYDLIKDEKYLDIALQSLNFLISVCYDKDVFLPIGQRGWYMRNSMRAFFDQQPLEASSMVQALTLAYELTGNKDYLDKSYKAFSWFLGDNMLNHALYNDFTGGCYDGLGEFSININQGAESTVSYLIARLSIDKYMIPNKIYQKI